MNYFYLVGWIGTVLFIFGAIALSNKNHLGFWCNGIANLFYVAQSIIRPNVPLIILSLFLTVINIYGIYNWRIKKSKWKLGYCKPDRYYRRLYGYKES